MLKKTVTYTDFNGTERTEDFYFNLTKAEIWEMDMSVKDKEHLERSYSDYVRGIMDRMNGKEIMAFFKDLILRAYGEKSEDGKRFIKSEELSTNFSYTEAYSELFIELCTNADAASEFVRGIMPVQISDEELKAAQREMQN